MHRDVIKAARLVVKKRECDSITPTLRDDLHWLLVRQQVDLRTCLLVYKCLHQLAPEYLTSLLTPVTPIATRRHLRSANAGDLATLENKNRGPRSTKFLGCWLFSVEQFAVGAQKTHH